MTLRSLFHWLRRKKSTFAEGHNAPGTGYTPASGVTRPLGQQNAVLLPAVATPRVPSSAIELFMAKPPAGPHDADLCFAPATLDDFIGQRPAVERLRLACECARRERRNLDSVLITGPTGCGKSTLAGLLAQELHARPALLRAAAGYKLENLKSDLNLLAGPRACNPILVLDELHAASRQLRDAFLVACDQLSGQARHWRGPLAVCVVGLTNRSLDSALRRRFLIQIELEMPAEQDLETIIHLFARRSGSVCDPDAIRLLARVAFSPGKARALFAECRNRAVAQRRPIDGQLVLETFATLGIDPESGLDQKQIAAMCYLGQVGQASARSIALALGVDESAYQYIEEWLVRRRCIVITSRGRALTQTGASLIRRTDPV